jgi:PAS domain S-box-containing protein
MSEAVRDTAPPRAPAEGPGFAEALERAEIGALLVDSRGAVTWCNPRFAQLLRRPLEEVLGAEWVGLVAPDRREAMRRLFERVATGAAESFQHDAEVERGDGERRVLRWTATRRPGEGRFDGLAFLAEDVTGRRQVAEAHRIARAALDGSGTAIAMGDEHGRIVYANPALLQLWGYERETEALGRSIASFWADPAVAASAAGIVRREGHWHGELIARRADGSEATFRVHSNLFEDPETCTLRAIATFEDVTELRATEDRLRWAQRLAQVGDWSIDLATVAITCSEEACRILRVAGTSFVGTRDEFLALVHPDDRPRVYVGLTTALGQSEPLALDFRVAGPDGGRVVHAEARPVHDAAGRLVQLRGVFQDVTERVRADHRR